MISDKAKRLLKKVQALSDNLSDQGSVSVLERDLLLSYLRELYDELSTATVPASRPAREEDPRPVAPRIPVVEERPADIPALVVQPPVAAPAAPRSAEPVMLHGTATEEAAPPPRVPTPEPVYYYPPPSNTQTASPVTAVKEKPEGGLSALFEFKESGELSEKLKLQPVERIEHGMGINERMLAINELFNGDGELFKKTLDHLNALTTFGDAQAFLSEGIASVNDWGSDAKKLKAVNFIQLVRRRYVTR